ncbi:MAG TPA: DinB family protein [Dongiaceae bacterium]|nr:DinB family protein [Dongiaceae bacterium]
MNTRDVHPAWASRLSFELNGLDQEAQALVAGLTEEQLNWQPVAGSWSIGQCMEHLCITNDAYLPRMTAALDDKADAPVEQITQGWLSGWFLKNFVEPAPNARKVPAPGKIRPASQVGTAVIERFLASNKACRELIVRARSKDVNRIRFWNPLAPGIRFTVGMGFEIIASHEQRHLLQAERVKDSPKFPKSSTEFTFLQTDVPPGNN